MKESLLRLPEVITRTGLPKRTIYHRMRLGTFPKAVKLGPNAVAWRESEISAWICAPAEWSAAA